MDETNIMFHSFFESVPTVFGRAHNHFQFQSLAIDDGDTLKKKLD
jgi:hypothetical protein